jgi:LysM repeat protein
MRVLTVAVVAAVAVIALAGVTADTALAAPVQQVQAYHVVQPGQTLFCIGRGYHVNPWSIAQANYITNPNYLRVGQTLVIPYGPYWYVPGPTCTPQSGQYPPPQPPPGPPPPPCGQGPSCGCTTYHVVKCGETLYSISLMYGTTVQAIAAANGIANPNYIRVGQQLCIPGGAPHPMPKYPGSEPQPVPYDPGGGHGGHGGH